MWALDFQFDSTWHGKTIKICNIIDEYTRQHVAFTVDRRLDAASVIELLDVACLNDGRRPRVIRMDNGPEFIASLSSFLCKWWVMCWGIGLGSGGRVLRGRLASFGLLVLG